MTNTEVNTELTKSLLEYVTKGKSFNIRKNGLRLKYGENSVKCYIEPHKNNRNEICIKYEKHSFAEYGDISERNTTKLVDDVFEIIGHKQTHMTNDSYKIRTSVFSKIIDMIIDTPLSIINTTLVDKLETEYDLKGDIYSVRIVLRSYNENSNEKTHILLYGFRDFKEYIVREKGELE